MWGLAATALVGAGLLATGWAQVRPLPRGRRLLDLLAIVPEWRFFAAASLAGPDDLARDVHLIVRDREGGEQDGGGRIGRWRPLLWHAERTGGHALWNAHRREGELILSIAEDLADGWARAPGPGIQQSIPYLVLLSRSLAAPADPLGADRRQFAVVRTPGRSPGGEARVPEIGFVSGWHRR